MHSNSMWSLYMYALLEGFRLRVKKKKVSTTHLKQLLFVACINLAGRYTLLWQRGILINHEIVSVAGWRVASSNASLLCATTTTTKYFPPLTVLLVWSVRQTISTVFLQSQPPAEGWAPGGSWLGSCWASHPTHTHTQRAAADRTPLNTSAAATLFSVHQHTRDWQWERWPAASRQNTC